MPDISRTEATGITGTEEIAPDSERAASEVCDEEGRTTVESIVARRFASPFLRCRPVALDIRRRLARLPGHPLTLQRRREEQHRSTARDETAVTPTSRQMPHNERKTEKGVLEMGVMNEVEKSRLNILVVENEGLLRLSIMDMIEDMGHVGFEAPSADAALKFLADGRQVDVMLIDIGLPDMDGLNLARRARRLRPDLYLVFATGYGPRRLSDATAELMAGYLPKPYRMHDLEQALAGFATNPRPAA